MPAERARRAIPLALAWFAAAIVAVAVASWGVALVGRSVTEDRPAALASAEVAERLSEVDATSPATSTSTSPPSSSSQPPDATTTTAAGEVAPTTPPQTAPSTTAPSPTTTSPPPPPEPPTTAAGETRTYALVGGTASLRFAATGVTVVFANPAQGFDVEIEPEHGNGVRVEFDSEAHESRLDGWWDGGPREQVEERPDR